MKWARSLRALARIELRQLQNHPGRSCLILALMALPVAALTAGSTLVRIAEATPEERATSAMGRADLRVGGLDTFERLRNARAALPSGSESAVWFKGVEQASVPGRRLRATLHALDPGALGPGGLAEGIVRIERGRAPANSGEVALSPALLDDLDRSIGDTVTLAYGTPRTITGVVRDPEDLDLPLVLRTPAHVEHRGTHTLLAAVPDNAADAAATTLKNAGFLATTRAEAEAETDGLGLTVVFAIGCIAFFEAGLVIAAAFAISLKRRQREIGLLGATGAPAIGIVLSVMVSAAALALASGAVGAALGAGAAALVHPALDGWLRRLNGGFEVPWGQAAGAGLLGLLAAMAAAGLPARRAARIPIREALSGRRPNIAPTGSWLAAGVAMLAAAIGLLLLLPRDSVTTASLAIIGSPVLMVLGLGAISPWVLAQLARRADPLPAPWRLAVRDAGRFRARNGPVVTAVLAGMSISVAAAVVVASVESAIDSFPPPYRDDQLLIEGPGSEQAAKRIVEELRGLAASAFTAAYAHGQPVRARFAGAAAEPRRAEWVACGGEDLLRALGAEAAAEDFRAGKLVALRRSGAGAPLELSTWLGGRPFATPPVAVHNPDQPVAGPHVVISDAALERLGMESGPPLNRALVPWVVRLDGPLTPRQLEQARAIASRSRGATVDAALLHQRPAHAYYYFALLACGITGLAVILVSTALSAAESEGDRRILHTVGATSAALRTHAAARSGYLALIGCLLAVPAGLVIAKALFGAVNFPLPYVMPWRDLLATVIALPAVVYAITWLWGIRLRPAAIGWKGSE